MNFFINLTLYFFINFILTFTVNRLKQKRRRNFTVQKNIFDYIKEDKLKKVPIPINDKGEYELDKQNEIAHKVEDKMKKIFWLK